MAPKLSAKEAGEQAARLTTQKKGIFGKITSKVDPYVKEIAETVQRHVPDFNPSKTISENLNAVKGSIGTIAENLKESVIRSGKDKIYSFKELGSRMNAIEKPISLRGTPFEKQLGPIRNAALEIARKHGGHISDLLPARQEFDDLVERTYPNLYDNAHSPMRTAITSIRKVMNDFVAENVEDVAFRESMEVQTKLYRALDNMSEKIASGETKELGTTALKRFGNRHPTLKKLAKYGAVAAGGGILFGD